MGNMGLTDWLAAANTAAWVTWGIAKWRRGLMPLYVEVGRTFWCGRAQHLELWVRTPRGGCDAKTVLRVPLAPDLGEWDAAMFEKRAYKAYGRLRRRKWWLPPRRLEKLAVREASQRRTA